MMVVNFSRGSVARQLLPRLLLRRRRRRLLLPLHSDAQHSDAATAAAYLKSTLSSH
jgi:hypothetical protein